MSIIQRHERAHERRKTTDFEWAARAAAGLAIAFALASFAAGMPLDVRWGAPLASAWLNAFIVANGARLALGQRPPRRARKRNWRLLTRALWRALRHQRGVIALYAVVRSIPWQPWGACASACLSAALTAAAWNFFSPAALIRASASPIAAMIASAFMAAQAFLVLIAERAFQAQADESPTAASLASLLRIVVATSLAAAGANTWLAYRHVAPDLPLRAAAALNAAIAVELTLRAALLWFLPKASRATTACMPSSALAGMFRLHPSPLAAFAAALRRQYGVDFRQNWAFRSFVRLAPATLFGVGLCAWLLTSIVILGPEQRAVYERFGAPVAVWRPGLHVGLPRPFGAARLVDNGAVHQVIVSGSADDRSVAGPLVRADDPAPDLLNRLWDVAHPWETTQVIAGASGERQNFEVVSADVRLDYRVGASDADARAALYRAVDVQAAVRSIANREVVRYLASHTLESLLEASQTGMAESVRAGVQRQLDALHSGVEVMAIVIESIHPPAGAAAAFHAVQAAQVSAQASVASARAYSAVELGDAKEQALQKVARASADAADALSRARVQQVDFAADLDASAVGGPAFLFEYYLHKLQEGLRNARLTVIDDRLAEGGRATLDLRAYSFGDLAGTRRYP